MSSKCLRTITHIQGLFFFKKATSLWYITIHINCVLYMYVPMPYISMRIPGCMPHKVAEKNWMTQKGASFSMAQNYRFSLHSDPLTLQHWAKKKKITIWSENILIILFARRMVGNSIWTAISCCVTPGSGRSSLVMRVSDSGCSVSAWKQREKENDEHNWPLSPDFSCDSLSLRVVLCVSPWSSFRLPVTGMAAHLGISLRDTELQALAY